MWPSTARIGAALCVSSLTFCAVLHVATFVGTFSLLWIAPPFLAMAGAAACARLNEQATGFRRRDWNRLSPLAVLGYALLVYSLLTFVYFYRTTGGASSVEIVDGRYVSLYKGQVIRTITEHEYRMFPNLWTRVISAWIGMMSLFTLSTYVPTRFRDPKPSHMR